MTSPRPFCGRRCKAYSPDSSEKYAMVLPSGDQAGSRSITAVVLVRFRASPFSAGTVMMSPRASKTARAPVGEICALWSFFPTLTKCSRTSGISPLMRTSTALVLPDFRSYRCNAPNCS